MKYKLLALGAVLFILTLGVLATIPDGQRNQRAHQHRAAVPPAACARESGALCTHLPIVSIGFSSQPPTVELLGGGGTSWGKPHNQSQFVAASVRILDRPGQNHHPDDAPDMESAAQVKYRGNSSMHFDKKSYKVNLVHPDGSENKEHTVLGMPKHDKWVLNGPYLDKTLLRNYMCLNIAGEILPDTPEVRFCELFVDGTYQGVYVAMESVARGEDRVNLTKYSPGDPYTSYILRMDRDVEQNYEIDTFSKYAMRVSSTRTLEILYPGSETLTPQLADFINKDFSAFEKALYSFDYDDAQYGYPGTADTASFVDYFIINEFFKNYDAGYFSTYFYKDLKGKIHIGPVWDFNNSSDNYMEVALEPSGFDMMNRPWYFMLLKDEPFVEQIIQRYRTLRKGVLGKEYLERYIEETEAYLGGAVERNYAVWGYSFDPSAVDESNKLSPDARNPRSYEEALEQLQTYVAARGDWLDRNIELLLQYCHESKVKKFNH